LLLSIYQIDVNHDWHRLFYLSEKLYSLTTKPAYKAGFAT